MFLLPYRPVVFSTDGEILVCITRKPKLVIPAELTERTFTPGSHFLAISRQIGSVVRDLPAQANWLR